MRGTGDSKACSSATAATGRAARADLSTPKPKGETVSTTATSSADPVRMATAPFRTCPRGRSKMPFAVTTAGYGYPMTSPPPYETCSTPPWPTSKQLTRELHAKLTVQLAKLKARELRLIDLAADGLLDRTKILERSNAIQTERNRIKTKLADTSAELMLGAERLRQCFELVADPATLYSNAADEVRQELNSAFYKRFYIDDEPLAVAQDELNPPFDEIHEAADVYRRYKELTVGARDNVVTPISARRGINHKKRRSNHSAGAPNDRTAVLADAYPVSVSSKRVMVELLGRYSNWTSWTDRLPVTDKTGDLSRESRSRARRTARQLSDGDVAELVTRYQEGATVYELAKRFSIHPTTVSGHLHRRGVRLRGLSPDRRQVVVGTRLYQQGWSVARIGSHVGVDGSTVWRALRARGVRMRDTHGRDR